MSRYFTAGIFTWAIASFLAALLLMYGCGANASDAKTDKSARYKDIGSIDGAIRFRAGYESLTLFDVPTTNKQCVVNNTNGGLQCWDKQTPDQSK